MTTENDLVPSSSAEIELTQTVELERKRSCLLEDELTDLRSKAGDHRATLEQELEQTKNMLNMENNRVASLELELSEAMTLAVDLQGDLECSQRELLDRVDLHCQQEALVEKRCRELGTAEEKLR